MYTVIKDSSTSSQLLATTEEFITQKFVDALLQRLFITLSFCKHRLF